MKHKKGFFLSMGVIVALLLAVAGFRFSRREAPTERVPQPPETLDVPGQTASYSDWSTTVL